MSAPEAPAWSAVLLVCRECRKRTDGPRGPKPKEIVHGLKRSMRERRPRPRVLLTSCLGLCPKRATAVAHIDGAAGGARIVAMTSPESVDRLVPG